MDRDRPETDRERELREEAERMEEEARRKAGEPGHPNPPHTTTGKITAPKFGSAGSGGAELDPGYDKN